SSRTHRSASESVACVRPIQSGARSCGPPDMALSLSAGSNPDLFTAPDGSVQLDNATMQLTDAPGDFQLRARVSAPLASTFDAVALVVWAAPDAWGKLALQRSPQGQGTIVSGGT